MQPGSESSGRRTELPKGPEGPQNLQPRPQALRGFKKRLECSLRGFEAPLRVSRVPFEGFRSL